ncbi:MAG: hypothetical protein SPE18_00775 [Candidatus Limivicinus sp.]|nr:hypothetical protein [Candidatus Limivicinus sp.]
MKKKLIALVFALLLPVLALTGCGCEHEWVDATCTEPKTCSKCGETEGEPAGHTEGKWETVETDPVNASVTKIKHCTECGIELAEQTTTLEKLYKYGIFLLSPEQFAERMNIMLSEQGDSNLSVGTVHTDYQFICTILLDGEETGYFSFSNDDGSISPSQKDSPCINCLLGGVDGSEIITSVVAALIRTCDPSIDYSEAYELGCSLLETQDAKK